MWRWFKSQYFWLRREKEVEPQALSSDELLWRIQKLGKDLDAMREQRRLLSNEMRKRIEVK